MFFNVVDSPVTSPVIEFTEVDGTGSGWTCTRRTALSQGNQKQREQLLVVGEVLRAYNLARDVHIQDEYHHLKKCDEGDWDPVADPAV